MSMGWDYVSELRPPTGLLFTPRKYMTMDNHSEMISTEGNWLVHQSSLAIPPAESFSTKAGGTGKVNNKFDPIIIFVFRTSKGSLTCRKTLRYRNDGFTSPPNEVLLRIYIVLKNPSPRSGFKRRNLRLMARTLTITPPRTTDNVQDWRQKIRVMNWQPLSTCLNESFKLNSSYIKLKRFLYLWEQLINNLHASALEEAGIML
jgi:hypothetical protein